MAKRRSRRANTDPAPSPLPGEHHHEWVVLRTAPNQIVAELWRDLLLTGGIPATLSPADVISFLGVSPAPCRLLVPTGSREAAELVLAGQEPAHQDEER